MSRHSSYSRSIHQTKAHARSLPLWQRAHVAIQPPLCRSLGLASSLALAFMSGCTAPQEPTAPNAPVAGASAEAARSGESAAPSFGSWTAEVARRFREYPAAHPNAARRTLNTGLPVDVASIAARHPAWKLAQLLESGPELQPISLPFPRISGLHGATGWRGALGQGASWNWPGMAGQSTLGVGSAFSSPSLSPDFSGSPISGTAASSNDGLLLAMGLPALQAQMRQRQANALTAFFGSTEQTHQVMRNADLQARLAAMQEDIERAREVNLNAVDPLLPTEAIQLEMTNLRLHLQVLEAPGNMYAKSAEIAATRARLRELDAEWRRDLRSQESERRELLARLRDERPRRIELQRRREIEIAQRIDQERDEAARLAASAAARRRIAEDFETTDARLGIIFPGAPSGGANAMIEDSVVANAVPFRTRSEQRASIPPRRLTASSITTSAEDYGILFTLPQIEGVDEPRLMAPISGWAKLSSSERQGQIRRLRDLAWNDARQWARVVARRNADLKQSLQQSQRGRSPAKTQ
ncbi:MAG: hypothetical protein JWN98_2562 [Abditibacteriota bacterium]|nr:hypothetical protein [Abditibacteriota bacterium]